MALTLQRRVPDNAKTVRLIPTPIEAPPNAPDAMPKRRTQLPVAGAATNGRLARKMITLK